MQTSDFQDEVEKRFNETIEVFKKLGIRINPIFDFKELRKLKEWKQLKLDSVDETSFRFHLFYLISQSHWHPNKTILKREDLPVSNQVWHFDPERGEEVRYGDLIERLNLVAGNKYRFDVIENTFRPNLGVKFMFEGGTYQWEFRDFNDWADSAFLERFGVLINSSYENSLKKFFKIRQGQGHIIGYLPPSQIKYLINFFNLPQNQTPQYL